MMTKFETTKLLSEMRDELNAGTHILLKNALLLMLILGLAWIGTSTEDPAGSNLSSHAAQTTKLPDSYSRTVFEERRRHYVEAHPDSLVAREAGALSQKDANANGGYTAYHKE